MRFKLNGKESESNASTIDELLEELNLPQTGIAVALNDQIVRRDDYAHTPLASGDEVEIIRAVQGGQISQ